MIRVTHNKTNDTIEADNEYGEFVLLTKSEWDNVAHHFIQIQKELLNQQCETEKLEKRIVQLEDENMRLAKNIQNIEKSLRTVCIDTENPIHF